MGKTEKDIDLPIDIVVLWVDDKDENWRNEKARYQNGSHAEGSATDDSRFRSWDNFQYLFRGIETFAPWVNHVYLVTNGQKPEWLKLDHPKLTLVTHKEIMPEDALPTFNSRAIELCVNKIKGLSEHFIYMNDDTFLTAPCVPEDFFKQGLPVDNPILGANIPVRGDKGFGETLSTSYSLGILNGNFRKKNVISGHYYNWFGPHLGLRGFCSAISKIHQHFFDGFKNHHFCQPFLKSTFNKVWDKEYDAVNITVHHRFRANNDINQWFVRYWQLAENKFYPSSLKDRFYINVNDDNVSSIARMLRSHQFITMCVNDSEICEVSDFNKVKRILLEAFQDILPNQSSFEK